MSYKGLHECRLYQHGACRNLLEIVSQQTQNITRTHRRRLYLASSSYYKEDDNVDNELPKSFNILHLLG